MTASLTERLADHIRQTPVHFIDMELAMADGDRDALAYTDAMWRWLQKAWSLIDEVDGVPPQVARPSRAGGQKSEAGGRVRPAVGASSELVGARGVAGEGS